MSQYTVYKRFNDPGLAREYFDVLQEQGIACQLTDNSPSIDITFSGNTYQNQTELKVKQVDFKKADEILESKAQEDIADVEKEYYLFEFSDEELYDVLLKKDEWNPFDYSLAQKILSDQGHSVDAAMLDALNKQRVDDLSAPDIGQKPWIYFGYFVALLGGLLGLLIGWYLWNSKKTLPDGQRVHSYRKEDQVHGRNIFLIGVLSTAAWIAYRLIK